MAVWVYLARHDVPRRHDNTAGPAQSVVRLIHSHAGGSAMAEGSNLDIAHTLTEQAGAEPATPAWGKHLEIVEALLLAVVAIATAWSGYQAAKWDGRQAELYGEASTLRIEADELVTLGGQQRLLDVSTFNTWIQAKNQGQEELAELYVRRFSPEYKTAFDAWMKTDPFSNPSAQPGPSFVPEYKNPLIEEGEAANEEASHVFDEGTAARHRADEYIRLTVVFATVLFMLALSHRFQHRVRLALLVPAGGLLIYAVVTIVTFPRL
jgi:hypothetical protein